MKDQRSRAPASVDNIYRLDGRVPVGNPVAGVFVVAMILSLTLPKKVKGEDIGALTEDTIERKPDETN